jgi:hypothetical protein
VALSAPAAPGSSPFDLPWTLTGGRGILGLDPIHGALAVFGALMGFTLLFLIAAALLTRWQWGRLNRRDAKAIAADRELVRLTPIERARLRADAGELIRQAAVTAAAAKRAKTAVTETRAMCEVAQQAREAAWVEFDAAQRAYDGALREAAAKTAEAAPAVDETETVEVTQAVLDAAVRAAADKVQKREMTHAALEAFKRGDITVDELNAVFKQATGWDPLVELQAREVELRRTAESRARRLFQAAAAAERAAVLAADVAAVAARALAEESVEMTVEAEAAREELVAAVRAGDPEERHDRRKAPKQRQRNSRAKPAVKAQPSAAARKQPAKAAAQQLTRSIPKQRVKPVKRQPANPSPAKVPATANVPAASAAKAPSAKAPVTNAPSANAPVTTAPSANAPAATAPAAPTATAANGPARAQ